MKGTLPAWIERLLGIDAAEAGEGTEWSLGHSWNWAPWMTLLFVAFCVGLVGWIYLRESRGGSRLAALSMGLLRLAAVAVVLLMLAELVLSRQRTGLPFVAVLVDDSASMGIADRYSDDELRSQLAARLAAGGFAEPTRLNQAKTLLLEENGRLLRGVERRYKLKLYFVSGAARGQTGEVAELLKSIESLEPRGESSRLGTAVRAVLDDLRGTPPAAVVLLSDGITTDGPALGEAAAYARRKSVPLFTVGLGSEEPIRNLKLHDVLVDEVVFVDDVVNFEYKLTGTGLEGRDVTVALKRQDQPTPLAEVRVRVGEDGQPQRLTIPYRPTEEGEFEYVLEVEELADEDQKADNRERRTVRVRKEQIKVLLVQSGPSWEFRRLKDMLERETTIELDVVLQEADRGYAEVDRSALAVFPVRREDLFAYDVVLFGDVDRTFLSALDMQNLADYIAERGRGIVFIAGPHYTPTAYRDTPLAALFPVDLSSVVGGQEGTPSTDPVAIVPTELGLASPHMQLGDSSAETAEIWRNLPGVYWTFDAPKLKPGARVLAEHPVRVGDDGRPLPLFVMQYVGKGKVLFHASDETWQWRYRVGDVFFARYWVQTIRYLSRTKLLGQDNSAELTSDRREYRRGEPVRLRVQFFDERTAPLDDDGVTVVLEREGQKNRQIGLRRSATSRGVFEGVFTNPTDGVYHAWIAQPTLPGGAPAADFSVVAPPGEFKRVQMDATELKTAAHLTDGKYYTLATAGELLDDLPEGRQVPIETLEPVVLWNKWPLVLLFAGLLVTEWVLRKRRGLL